MSNEKQSGKRPQCTRCKVEMGWWDSMKVMRERTLCWMDVYKCRKCGQKARIYSEA